MATDTLREAFKLLQLKCVKDSEFEALRAIAAEDRQTLTMLMLVDAIRANAAELRKLH